MDGKKVSKRKSGNVAAAVNRYQLLHRPTSSPNNSTKVGRLHKAARQGRGPQDTPSPVHTLAHLTLKWAPPLILL